MRNPDQKIVTAFIAYMAICMAFTVGLTGFMVWAIFQLVTNTP